MSRAVTRRSLLVNASRASLAAPLLRFTERFATAQEDQWAGSGSAVPDARRTLAVPDFGATGDGSTKDTAAIQMALDRCAVLGGGEVLIPAGNYLTGAIALRTNTVLRLDKDAVLLGSPDFADYPVTQVRWEGKRIQGHTGLIYAIDAANLGIAGPGKIAGNPVLGGRPNAQNPLRHPALIEFLRCSNIRLEDFSTNYDHMWSVHPTDCEDIFIRGLTIRSTGGNGDGIDIDSCRRVWIDHCDISTGDDCISLKSGRGEEGYTLHRPTGDVRITNCTFADSIFACIGIGSETSGGIRNVRIEHCRFTHARTYAIYIKTRTGRGAFIENISGNDLDVFGTEGGFLRLNLLNSGIQDPSPVPGLEGVPSAGGFHFSNIRVTDCPVLVDGIDISPDKPLTGFSLADVRGNCQKGIAFANVRNAEIRNVAVTGCSGPLIGIHNVTGKGLHDAAQIDGPKVPESIAAPARPYSPH
ncbi:MAG: glycoside hydrolase family 28 protein [Acidobacteriaceae bacterium]